MIPVHRTDGNGDGKPARASARVVAHAIVDDDMADLAQYFWVLHSGYAARYAGKVQIFMHHDVIGRVAGLDVSHENANPLDNRRENLTHATRAENKHNPNDPPRGVSGYRGVTFDPRRGARPYRGQVHISGRPHVTKGFATPIEAARALNVLRLGLGLRIREIDAPANLPGAAGCSPLDTDAGGPSRPCPRVEEGLDAASGPGLGPVPANSPRLVGALCDEAAQ